MRIYISGKITGTTDYHLRFKQAELSLGLKGYEVINPAKIGAALKSSLPFDPEYDDYMLVDEHFLKKADAIYMMKGYEESAGAKHELMIATQLGKEIIYEEVLP